MHIWPAILRQASGDRTASLGSRLCCSRNCPGLTKSPPFREQLGRGLSKWFILRRPPSSGLFLRGLGRQARPARGRRAEPKHSPPLLIRHSHGNAIRHIGPMCQGTHGARGHPRSKKCWFPSRNAASLIENEMAGIRRENQGWAGPADGVSSGRSGRAFVGGWQSQIRSPRPHGSAGTMLPPPSCSRPDAHDSTRTKLQHFSCFSSVALCPH